jgi:hypothetical protein
MVDCALRVGVAPLAIYYNRYYYVDLTAKQVLPGFLKNELYVPYNHIHKRTLIKHNENDYHYLIRVYYA